MEDTTLVRGYSNGHGANESTQNEAREEVEMTKRGGRSHEGVAVEANLEDQTRVETELESEPEPEPEPVVEDKTEEEADIEPKKEAIVDEAKPEKVETESEAYLEVLKKGEIEKGKEVDVSPSIAVAESSSGFDQRKLRHMPARLYKAAMHGNVESVKEYWERNPSILSRTLTPTGNSVLHVSVTVPIHVRTVSTDFLRFILDSNIYLLNLRNDRHETPLHLAANFGQLVAVHLFIETDSSLLSLVNVDGDSALHMAARNKHTQVVKFLLSVSSSHSEAYTTNNAGETALYLAVQTGSIELVDIMLEFFKAPQHGSELTGTILHAAILWGDTGMSKRIANKYPELVDYKDVHGQTPVHYAAGINNSVLQILLQDESSTAAYIRDNAGRTPAHIAAQQNNVDGLKLIVDKFPDSCEIEDNQGRNIVHYAAFLGRIEALDYFLTDALFSDLVNKRDDDGNTPLHWLAKSLTELPIVSLSRIRPLIPKLKTLQLKTYNKKDLTPGDIANDHKIFELEPPYQEVVKDFRDVAPKGGRVKHWLQPLEKHKVDIEAQRDESASNILRTAKTHMVVATLIATVSFAAGLGVPGGFNQDTTDQVKGGTAMLGNKVPFRVFLISDCIALASSLTAILFYFWLAMGKGKGSSKALFFWAFEASSVSIVALMVAFMAGIYSILQPSNIVFAGCAILILSIFIYFYCIFAMGVIQLTMRIRRLMGEEPQKLKKQVVYGKVETQNPRPSYLGPTSFALPFRSLVFTLAEYFILRVRRRRQ